MLGGFLKLTLSLNVLFLFVIFLWQAAIADASPISVINNNLAKSNDDVFNNHRGAPLVKRSLHSTVDQQTLIGCSRLPCRSRSRHRRLRKKLHSSKLKNSSSPFQSTGIYNEDLRPSNQMQAVIDDRLKRFRMLEPDEFQEMLNSLSQQTPDVQSKGFNSMDTIDGMQLENYWSRK